MGRAIGRIILVPLGFVLGLLASAGVLVTLGLERFTQAAHGRQFDESAIDQIFGLFRDAQAVASAATLVPAVLVVIIGEVGRIRSALFYMVGGGIALAGYPLLLRLGTLGPSAVQSGVVWQVLATAGFLGGAVYWLVAGKRA